MNITFTWFSLIIFSMNFISAQTKDATPPEVKIPGSQIQHLQSSIVGREYELDVYLPRDYRDTTKTFPVLYLLDSQWDFPLVQAILGEQFYDGLLPGIVLVGITWGGNNPNYDSLRARDLTPVHNQEIPQSGNAPQFLRFIKEELLPYVEKNYRVKKDDRALMGSSFGGLFTLYTVFTETRLFDKYVLTSPAIMWDNRNIYGTEEKYAKENSSLPVKMYMTIGAYENVEELQRFIKIFKSREYKGLELETSVLSGIGHSGTKAEGYTRGLQFVYKRPVVNVDPKILERYRGDYLLPGGVTLKLSVDGNHLAALAPNGQKFILLAEGEKDFYANGAFLLIHFVSDQSEKITGFKLVQYGGESFVKKL
jgi:predicted alpha/beta superfamily hydrolase